jgi:hypothetical protein
MKRACLLALVLVVLILAWVGLNRLERAYDTGPNYTEIEPGLWLGGQVTQPPPGTRAVLNLCESDDPYRVDWYQAEPIRDAAPAPSLNWLRQQVDWITEQRRQDRIVYVHCRNGVSRSAMVLAAFLMHRENLKRDEALTLLRSRRPIVRPNPAFLELLAEWERR